MIGLVVLLALVATGAVGLTKAARRRRQQRRRLALQACVAPVVELISVVVGAGGTVGEAITVVAEQGPVSARPCFATVLARQARGDLLADALHSISAELGSAFHPLATSLMVAEQGGAPVGMLLQRLAEESQQARSRAMTDALGRLPVAMLTPLVVCQLPALVIGSVIPLTIVAIRQLSW